MQNPRWRRVHQVVTKRSCSGVKWVCLLEGLEGCSKTMDAEAGGGGIYGGVSLNRTEEATLDHLRI
jgi:hypothetical protein